MCAANAADCAAPAAMALLSSLFRCFGDVEVVAGLILSVGYCECGYFSMFVHFHFRTLPKIALLFGCQSFSGEINGV